MPRLKVQRYAITYFVALKKTCTETVAVVREANGDNAMTPKNDLALAQDFVVGQSKRSERKPHYTPVTVTIRPKYGENKGHVDL